MVDVNPDIEKRLKDELEKLTKQYGDGSSADNLSKFPTFNFQG